MPVFLLFIAAPDAAPITNYVDPTSGGMMLQLLFGGAVGFMVAIKLFIGDKIRVPFRTKPRPATVQDAQALSGDDRTSLAAADQDGAVVAETPGDAADGRLAAEPPRPSGDRR